MALTRRLFIGGLLASAAAPAIITSKGFKPAVGRGYLGTLFVLDEPGYGLQGTDTGRMTFDEPAWQELRRASGLPPHQREAMKQILFGARYGMGRLEQARGTGKPVVALDFSELELRVIAQREQRSMFDALKIR